MDFTFIIVWLLCGVVCGMLAREKNRNIVWGCIAGFLFGLIAVIIYALIKKKEI